MEIRRALAGENAAINAVVSRVVNDTYAGQWTAHIDIGEDDWSAAWLAIVRTSSAGIDGAIAGIVMTEHDWVTNLWVDFAHHRHGIGRQLLATAEREIAERGIATAWLRVVSTNARAVAFYDAVGWQRSHEIMREGIPVPMIVYTKQLS